MGLKTGIWASRLGFEGGAKKEEEEEEEEKIPHMFESIGHRSLRSRCPKTNADSKILPTKFMISKFFSSLRQILNQETYVMI